MDRITAFIFAVLVFFGSLIIPEPTRHTPICKPVFTEPVISEKHGPLKRAFMLYLDDTVTEPIIWEEPAPLEVYVCESFIPYSAYYDSRDGRTHDIPMSYEDQRFAYECCERYDVPFDLAMAIFGVETGWNVNYGVSPSGKYCGIGMLHISYNYIWLKNELGIDIKSPKGGIEGSIYILSLKLQRFGSQTKAAMAYNLGDGGARAKLNAGVNETSYTKFVKMIQKGLKQ